MSDRLPPEPAVIIDVLRYAIASAGPIEDPAKWRGQLAILIPEIVAVLGEGSSEYRQALTMMTSPVLVGDFVSAKLNDSNHRIEVTIQCAERDPEAFWSERTDTPLGAAQAKTIHTIKKGNRVRVWKGLRQISQTKQVRDLLHIQRLDADLQVPSSSSPTPPGVVGTAEGSGVSGGTPEPHSGVVLNYLDAIERLKGDKRVQLAKWAHTELGAASLYDANLTPDHKNKILAQCELIQQGLV